MVLAFKGVLPRSIVLIALGGGVLGSLGCDQQSRVVSETNQHSTESVAEQLKAEHAASEALREE